MPLTLLAIGEKAKVIRLTCQPDMNQYLSELGFILGRTVEMIQHAVGDHLIVGLSGTRIAIDRKLAHNIHITLDERGN